MNDLPDRWERTKLRCVTEPRSGKVVPDADDRRPYLSLDGLVSGAASISGWERACDYRSQSAELFPGDVVYSRLRPYLNKVGLADRHGLGSSELIVFPESTVLQPHFLLYLLTSAEFVSYASAMSDGDRPRLKWKQMGGFEFGLPPLPEQRRIVGAIEEHLSRLAVAHAGLDRSRQRLGALGHGAWLRGVEDDWPRSRLSDVLLKQDGRVLKQGWSPRCLKTPSQDHDTWGVLKTSAVQFRRFDPWANKELPKSLAPKPELEVLDGDMIVTSGGPRSRIGVTCMARAPRPRLMLCDKMFRFRTDPRYLDPEFLLMYLTSPEGLQDIEKIKTGSNDSGLRISQGAFEGLMVPVPPLALQSEVVQYASEVSSQVEAVNGALDSAMGRSAALRRSILSSAFAGQLVPQIPSDEPASVLLERIASERAATKPSRRKKAAS